jgi:hypothetical protein
MHCGHQRVLTHRQRVVYRPDPHDEEGRGAVEARAARHRFGEDDRLVEVNRAEPEWLELGARAIQQHVAIKNRLDLGGLEKDVDDRVRRIVVRYIRIVVSRAPDDEGRGPRTAFPGAA